MSQPIHPRCDTDTCIKCRRKFKPGDRTVVVYIVEKLAVNPANVRQQGSWLSGEFEMAHFMCDDPQITPGTIILGSKG